MEVVKPTESEKRDYYLDLRVQQTATQSQINIAYHKLALIHHPDKKGLDHVTDDAQFKPIDVLLIPGGPGTRLNRIFRSGIAVGSRTTESLSSSSSSNTQEVQDSIKAVASHVRH